MRRSTNSLLDDRDGARLAHVGDGADEVLAILQRDVAQRGGIVHIGAVVAGDVGCVVVKASRCGCRFTNGDVCPRVDDDNARGAAVAHAAAVDFTTLEDVSVDPQVEQPGVGVSLGCHDNLFDSDGASLARVRERANHVLPGINGQAGEREAAERAVVGSPRATGGRREEQRIGSQEAALGNRVDTGRRIKRACGFLAVGHHRDILVAGERTGDAKTPVRVRHCANNVLDNRQTALVARVGKGTDYVLLIAYRDRNACPVTRERYEAVVPHARIAGRVERRVYAGLGDSIVARNRGALRCGAVVAHSDVRKRCRSTRGAERPLRAIVGVNDLADFEAAALARVREGADDCVAGGNGNWAY